MLPASDHRPANPDLFISYAAREEDLSRAAALHERLTAEGFTVWLDQARLKPGCDWHKEVEAGCEAARVMLPVITPRWANSEWTRYETYPHAAVIPVLAEGTPGSMPLPLQRWMWVPYDPLAPDEPAWQALLAAIRAKLAEPRPDRPPRVVDLPYAANPFFTGRDDELVRIHEELHTAPAAALTQGRVRVLAAMGGIGKTTLANEYARRFWRLYPQILWVDARRGYEAEFARLFDRLFPERAAADLKLDEKARQALAELNGRAERLLVIDNVEDAASVRRWLPGEATGGCRTLITSRFADFPAAAGIRLIELDVLDPDASRRFLLTRTGRTAEGTEREACDSLARELGHLPLALEQAAAYIAAPGSGVDFAGYLQLLAADTADLLARQALGSTDYPDAVITTWQTTVKKLSPDARAILRLCAWYADTPLPRGLMMDGAREVLALATQFGSVATPADPTVETRRLRDALMELARYSMILDATGTTFRVHGLVQAVERVQAEEGGRPRQGLDQALDRLTAAFPMQVDNPAEWPLCRQLLPHQRALVERLGPDSASATLPVLLDRAGRFLRAAGEVKAALPLFRRALESRQEILAPDHPDLLASMLGMAGCLQAAGDAAAALPLLRRALEGCERALGADHALTITSMNNLGACLRALGETREALQFYRRAMVDIERLSGPEHPDTLTGINNVARCLEALGDGDAALSLFRRALEGRVRVLGAEHPQTLASLDNLAGCLQTVDRATEALPLYSRALDGRERVLGATHPDTLVSVANLAGCLTDTGDATAALPLCRRAVSGNEQVLGAEHPRTLTCINNLAYCLDSLGQRADALPLFRRALESCERRLGAAHPETLVSANNLAGCLLKLGNAVEALPHFHLVLRVREQRLGETHPSTLNSMNNLAFCLLAVRDTASALPLFRRVLEGQVRRFGADHPETRASADILGGCLQALEAEAETNPEWQPAAALLLRVLARR